VAEESVSRVYDLLRRLPAEGLTAAKQLFWTELNYDRAATPLSDREWPEHIRSILAEPPTLFATANSEMGAFNVIYCTLAAGQVGRSQPLSVAAERQVIGQLLPNHPYALFIFSDPSRQHWHVVNVRADKDAARRRILRRIAVGPHERLRTAAERIAMLDVRSLGRGLFGISPLAIQQLHDRAFDVEAVTEQFFREYCTVFAALQRDLEGTTKDQRWAHDYTLQLLNRLMFLYFIQRKLWLGNDPDFLANFWRQYRQSRRPENSFVSEWLFPLFFEAFSNRFQGSRADRQYLPAEVRDALAMAPYLNGGLFEPSELDRKYEVAISDSRFELVFRFLEKYNFTISEDTPLDQEVAVDPEMIGKVYESLVNVSEEADERGDAGIFYTPRVEIDLMCRLSLVSWLVNQLGDQHRSLIYQLVFAFEPDDKQQADATVASQNLWPRLNELLRSVTVVDPACGSGSFLVGMLYVLDDLLARADAQLGIEETAYERKKRIVGNCLYGVDVMAWAVHVAELRLWLQLVVDTPFSNPAELKFRPLLPNLSFKIRSGDSLVQEIGGINLALRKGNKTIPAHLKGQITQLKGEKLKFYASDPTRKYQTAQQLQAAELGLYRDIVGARLQAVEARLKEVEDALAPRVNLFGELSTTAPAVSRLELERERDRLRSEQSQLVQARQALRTAKDVPFVWDIAFVEVFEGDRGGFDIVIGNPPYVRHELIRDPRCPAEETTVDEKRLYKAKLARSIYAAWPLTFGYDWTTGKATRPLDAKSDLYVYFYFHGLSLLSERGAFCFITSNSWLDVSYGRDLQEFLLTRGKLIMIIDNEGRRSFVSAAVNTVIALLGPPEDSRLARPISQGHVARFVMLKVPFENTLSPVIWEEVEESDRRQITPEYRNVPLQQAQLLVNGTDSTGDKYAGDKWGGKYLRAPDIYWTVLAKAAGKLVRLGDVAEVRFGIKTGANDFFLLDEQKVADWGIEDDFLVPVLKSPRECKRLTIDPTQLKYRLFVCHLPVAELIGTNALKYIRWGEANGIPSVPSVRGRNPWYDIGSRRIPPFTVPSSFSDLFRAFENGRVLVDKRLYEVYPRFDLDWAWVALNCTLNTLFLEIGTRTGLGLGLLDLTVYEVADCPIMRPQAGRRIDIEIIQSLKSREVMPIETELQQADRLALDKVIFDVIGLDSDEQAAVYSATIELVNKRLSKASSLDAELP